MTEFQFSDEEYQDVTYEEKRFRYPLLSVDGTQKAKVVDLEHVADFFGEQAIRVAHEILEGPDAGTVCSSKEIQITGDYWGKDARKNVNQFLRSCGMPLEQVNALKGKKVTIENLLNDQIGKVCYPTFQATGFVGRDGDVVLISKAIAGYKTPETYEQMKAKGTLTKPYDRSAIEKKLRGDTGNGDDPFAA